MVALRLAFPFGVMFSVLALASGRVDVPSVWAWTLVMWLGSVVIYDVIEHVCPALLAARRRPPSDRDRATRWLIAGPLLGGLIVSGLDVRHAWSVVPIPVQVLGLAVVTLGMALAGWVLLTNPFASSAVRIQEERGQRVITTGPYALVRHPMYLATLLVCLGSGPAIGSWWGGLVFLGVLPIFVRRTLIEDRILQDELEGYRAYAERVRWRVIPYVF